MIPRYTPADFATLWSSTTRYQSWLTVELAACDAMESAGLVPVGTATQIRALNLVLDPNRIEEIENTTRHDVIAFLTHVEELAGPRARFLHRGLTSSDILDTSFAILLCQASDLLLSRLDRLLAALSQRSLEHKATVMIGRSHGIHAEPVTFGLVLAGHFAEMKRAKTRLEQAKQEIAVGKLSGAVGTYAHISPKIEETALAALGLRPETLSTQVVARDRHAAFFMALSLIASSIERLATNIRHWQRTEVHEAEEFFSAGQKGSSAMPHKRNPIGSENLCGLARIVRSAVIPALENVCLWHERDISHSAVERMIAPDSTATVAFMLDRSAKLVENLVVYPESMQANLDKTKGLYFSEAVMLALVSKGMNRQDAYVIVQRNAMRAIDGPGDFRSNLASDAQILSHLSPIELDTCFDLKHALRFVEPTITRALQS